jgi:hypothetical protein
VLFPFLGLVLPYFIACYALYILIASVTSFHYALRDEKDRQRSKVARK